jgi:hypothetical protein
MAQLYGLAFYSGDLSRPNDYVAVRIDLSSMRHASPNDLSGSGARL